MKLRKEVKFVIAMLLLVIFVAYIIVSDIRMTNEAIESCTNAGNDRGFCISALAR